MVCDRCKTAVKAELDKNGIRYNSVELGEIGTVGAVPDKRIQAFRQSIERLGFELIDDRKTKIIERIKGEIINLIRNQNGKSPYNLSNHLARLVGKDYSTLSTLFSSVEGITIEHYFINQKIERAKELLAYNELSIKEIADQLSYSSVSHLSNQFKKVTGLTPGHFKKVRNKIRHSLDKI